MTRSFATTSECDFVRKGRTILGLPPRSNHCKPAPGINEPGRRVQRRVRTCCILQTAELCLPTNTRLHMHGRQQKSGFAPHDIPSATGDGS
jgi:hypothetical protein